MADRIFVESLDSELRRENKELKKLIAAIVDQHGGGAIDLSPTDTLSSERAFYVEFVGGRFNVKTYDPWLTS